MMWKDYLAFSKSERVAFWSFSIVMIFSVSLVFAVKKCPSESSAQSEKFHLEVSAYFESLNDSVGEMSFSGRDGVICNLNRASLSDLGGIGFNKFQAGNIMAFRKKGGVFHRVSDLLKIYGMDSISYIKVYNRVEVDTLSPQHTREHHFLPKIKNGEYTIELNRADTAILSYLPGIGPVLSARMVRYRESIGGFYAISQLFEIYGFDSVLVDKVRPHLHIDTTDIKPLDINKLSMVRMKNHPYLDFYQAKDIYEFRKKWGRFTLLNQVFELESFKRCDKVVIRRYFTVK